jgi:CrcB protein
MTWLAIAIGGALGSVARHGVNVGVTRAVGTPVPYAVATVNIVGCFAIGLLAGLVATGRLHLSDTARAFIFVGVLGGFTTFSSFGLDVFTLASTGRHAAAAWNVAGQVAGGLAALYAGYAMAH